uniref:non-specific serine/threonine protein kinase n=1 Tax=Pohlia nutans TaxID=140635 RepID=A0A1P8DYZ1_9BRYO|nr:leucine-rich repeat receptor-like protein kinase [Pohlia nutans]
MLQMQFMDNNFTGDLTLNVQDRQRRALNRLEILNVHMNGFTGNLAEALDALGCSALAYLDLSFNQFHGVVPAALGNCSSLWFLNLQSNLLTGSIPAELGYLQKLECLGLGSNGITGTIPENVTQCRVLSTIDVSLNFLSGSIPRWLSQMPSLRYFTAHSNKISGEIPLELAQAPTLYHFDVGNNSLRGEIPPELANLTTLRFLRLARNQFGGSVPSALGNLTALQGLDLSVNYLSGPLPSSFGNLRRLLWLQMADNQLTGSIPPEMTKCASLLWLNLRNNLLTGELPRDFFSLGLDAAATFWDIQQANEFPPMNFGECSLTQSWIPGEETPFENMVKILNHDMCRAQWMDILRGVKVSLSYWQLSNNSFVGPIPVPVPLQTSNLSCLFLSRNEFSGSIPANFSHVPFYNIDLRHNQISGSIPDIFEALAPTLQSLQLSYNNLSGPLPSSLNKLSFLSSYNFSGNPELEGPVPYNASFRNFDPSAYLNDTKLCRWRDATQIQIAQDMRFCSTLPPGPGELPRSSQSGFAKHLVLACTLIGVFGGILLFLVVGSLFLLFLKCRKLHLLGRKQAAVFMDVDSDCRLYDHASPMHLYIPVKCFQDSPLRALTYSDLVLATDNFSSAKIIGDGGFGMVYKAKLADGTTVAIKKLVLDGAQGDREFQAEMETLGLITHTNLVPLLGYCCRLRERLLVYKCLSNGSLDDWLYESEERAAMLSWPLRLRIAAGIAQGLAFLHHQCTPLIIHRDMKTSNILLDENFDACLTDFGLARLMDLQMTHVSTVVAGTPGYVPPEYGETWRATAKGDVYSFGVVMLELASGKRPIGPEFHSMEGGNLVAWVTTLLRSRRHREVYDPVVVRTGDSESIWQFLSLAVSCTSTDARLRPSMLHVTATLQELKSRQDVITAQRSLNAPGFLSDTIKLAD